MNIASRFSKGAALAAVAVLSASTAAAASSHTDDVDTTVLPSGKISTVINFEITDKPCAFLGVGPLRDRYAGVGVHVRGPAPLDGAAILDECSNFGVDARSGEAFLAVNNSTTMANGGTPRGPITVRFDDKQRSVSIWVSTGSAGPPAETFKLVGKRGKNVIASDTVTTSVSDFQNLRVKNPQGFTKVVLRAVTSDGRWVADDLGIVSL